MSQADPWAKIWWEWYVSRSHIGLSGVALALGAPLMLIGRACAQQRNSDANRVAWRDAKGDEHPPSPDLVWFRHKNGKPYTAADLAGIVRFDVGAVQAALDELCGEETLVVSVDGCYGMPRFWKYQETSAAARMRKHRENNPRNSYAPRDGSGYDKKREERREKTDTEGVARAGARTTQDDPPELEAGEPDAPLADRVSLQSLVRIRFSEAYDKRRGGPPPWPHQNVTAARAIAEWLEPKGRTGQDYERMLARLLANFFADPRMEAAAFPIAFLAADADKHLNPPTPLARASRRRTSDEAFTPPAPASAFPQEEQDSDDLFGPRKKPKEAANA